MVRLWLARSFSEWNRSISMVTMFARTSCARQKNSSNNKSHYCLGLFKFFAPRSRFGLFRRSRLPNKEALLPPTIEPKNDSQRQAAEKIRAQHVACPVLTQVNS